ncbi:MAG TPA: M48 family metallopeptidase [Candidatus Acidoferrales bacterium]|nr:M48 family metallopeptidase [Candidatus Acidoferrales bacterium]
MKRLTAYATVSLMLLAAFATGRGEALAGSPRSFRETPRPWGSYSREEHYVARLRRVMLPLLQATNHPRPLNEVRVRIVEDRRINAASAGNGEFYVTTGLLDRSTDEQLRGVLAHEIAHDDLGHPARVQMLGAGLNLGVVLLERIFPGSSSITPLAGMLIANNYTQPQEYEADRHAVEILRRAGYPKETMIDALDWVMRVEGNTGGGFLSSHPATKDRIRVLKRLV